MSGLQTKGRALKGAFVGLGPIFVASTFQILLCAETLTAGTNPFSRETKGEKMEQAKKLRRFFYEIDRKLLAGIDGEEFSSQKRAEDSRENTETTEEVKTKEAQTPIVKTTEVKTHEVKTSEPKNSVVKTTGHPKQEVSSWVSYKEILFQKFSAVSPSLKEGVRSELEARLQKLKSHKELSVFRRKVEMDFGVKTVPARNPDLRLGKNLFQKHCAICHGSKGKGDGRFAKRLNPPPRAFTDVSVSAYLRPVMTVNYVLNGLPSGVMKPMDETMSPHDLWSLSFYVQMLTLDEAFFESRSHMESLEKLANLGREYSLGDLSIFSNSELLDLKPLTTDANQKSVLIWLRTKRPSQK